MRDFLPSNLEPIQDVIERVRLVKKPDYKDKDCTEIEKRFWHLDWKTQLDIYELWLDIDNRYTRMCLYRVLDGKYWGLLQELVNRGVERAAVISKRIMENSIKHMRTQQVAFFVTENAPIEIVRKYKKQLAYSLEIAYNSLAFRIGGDKDFIIDKDRLGNRLEYYDICAKFNLPVSNEEAIEDFKLYFKDYGKYLWCDAVNLSEYREKIQYSLLLNNAINNWRAAMGALGLHLAAKAFDQWDADLQRRINKIYEADSQFHYSIDMNFDRLTFYWHILIEMACTDLFPDVPYEERLKNITDKAPEIKGIIDCLDLRLVKPLEL